MDTVICSIDAAVSDTEEAIDSALRATSSLEAPISWTEDEAVTTVAARESALSATDWIEADIWIMVLEVSSTAEAWLRAALSSCAELSAISSATLAI